MYSSHFQRAPGLFCAALRIAIHTGQVLWPEIVLEDAL